MSLSPSLDDHNAMPSPLLGTKFRLTFDRLPNNPGVNPGKWALNCIQSTIPGETISKIEQSFPGGHTLTYPGKKTTTRSLASQFIEREDFQSSTVIKNWMEWTRGTKSGSAGAYKPGLVAVGYQEVFDSTGALANSYRLFNMWPADLAEVQLDSTNDTTGLLWSVTWGYDWFEDGRVTQL